MDIDVKITELDSIVVLRLSSVHSMETSLLSEREREGFSGRASVDVPRLVRSQDTAKGRYFQLCQTENPNYKTVCRGQSNAFTNINLVIIVAFSTQPSQLEIVDHFYTNAIRNTQSNKPFCDIKGRE